MMILPVWRRYNELRFSRRGQVECAENRNGDPAGCIADLADKLVNRRNRK